MTTPFTFADLAALPDLASAPASMPADVFAQLAAVAPGNFRRLAALDLDVFAWRLRRLAAADLLAARTLCAPYRGYSSVSEGKWPDPDWRGDGSVGRWSFTGTWARPPVLIDDGAGPVLIEGHHRCAYLRVLVEAGEIAPGSLHRAWVGAPIRGVPE